MYLQYRLYENANNDTSNILKEVLKNRGIDDYYTYLDLDESVVIPYQKLDNIENAVDLNKIVSSGKINDLIRIDETLQSNKLLNIAKEKNY